MTDLSTVKNRERLKPRREPYWQKLAQGHYVGYRPSSLGKGGNWTARCYDPETRKQQRHPLGAFPNLPFNDHFGAASAAAREWFTHLSAGGTAELITVQQACERYSAGKPEVARRFQQYVYADPIAKIKLHKLTDRQVRDWRKRLEALPALVSRSKKALEPTTRPRAASTVNRDMVPFRAALNQALGEGHVLSSRAWQIALAPSATSGRRNLYLDKGQRRDLLAKLPEDARPFIYGLCLLPLRPGALAEVLVSDLDVRRRELVIERDKAGSGRKILLSDEALALLEQQSQGRPGSEPLFTRTDGQKWKKDSWKKPFKAAVESAGLPYGATAYTLRHSTITDLIESGLPGLTVAQVSGTSVRMIEKHYGHLRQHQAAKALSTLAL